MGVGGVGPADNFVGQGVAGRDSCSRLIAGLVTWRAYSLNLVFGGLRVWPKRKRDSEGRSASGVCTQSAASRISKSKS